MFYFGHDYKHISFLEKKYYVSIDFIYIFILVWYFLLWAYDIVHFEPKLS